jgi:hypothetical protein
LVFAPAVDALAGVTVSVLTPLGPEGPRPPVASVLPAVETLAVVRAAG